MPSFLAARLVATALLLALALAPVAHCDDAPITIGPEEKDQMFIGYYIAPDSTEKLTVSSGSVWATRAGFANSCDAAIPLSSCAIPTACANSLLTFDNGDIQSCVPGLDCVTFTIFQTSPFAAPSASNINCRGAWFAHTVYRQLSETMTGHSASMTLPPTGLPSNTGVPHGGSGSGSDSSSDSGSNLGAIVGGAIGGIAILAAVAAGAFFLIRRRKRQQRMIPIPNSDGGSGSGGDYAPPGGGYSFPARTPSEFGRASPYNPSMALYGPGPGAQSPASWNNNPMGINGGQYPPQFGTPHSAQAPDAKYYASGVSAGWGAGGGQAPPSELADDRPYQRPGPYANSRGVPDLPVELLASVPSSSVAEAPSPYPGPAQGRGDGRLRHGSSPQPSLGGSGQSVFGRGEAGIHPLLGSPEPRI